ncbi:hypothetical protein Acr_15g0005380 [Actinidia rufa]|uniref:Uncharacterized protein n=1 Tax=Actinidia rufa TaxID=165716 RepID=A0A7J0FTA0_9ERIC|nr:hypothetical protein Acr_15g0005380 [Actinidia rufa]
MSHIVALLARIGGVRQGPLLLTLTTVKLSIITLNLIVLDRSLGKPKGMSMVSATYNHLRQVRKAVEVDVEPAQHALQEAGALPAPALAAVEVGLLEEREWVLVERELPGHQGGATGAQEEIAFHAAVGEASLEVPEAPLAPREAFPGRDLGEEDEAVARVERVVLIVSGSSAQGLWRRNLHSRQT